MKFYLQFDLDDPIQAWLQWHCCYRNTTTNLRMERIKRAIIGVLGVAQLTLDETPPTQSDI